MPHHLPLELVLAVGVSCCFTPALADTSLSEKDVDLFAAVIYRVEGGAGSSFPFGVKCHKHTYEEARQICKLTIRKNFQRWLHAGKPGHYYSFLADRYCPPTVDPLGNARWKKNFLAIFRTSVRNGPEHRSTNKKS